MIKLSHPALIYIAGSLWAVIGSVLLCRGIFFLFSSIAGGTTEQPFATIISGIVGHPVLAAVIIFLLAFLLGYLKGQYVLEKAAKKAIARIKRLPEPAPLQQIYGFKFYILILFMMTLGMSLNAFKVPTDIRGLIDVAVGIALLRGSFIYFKSAQQPVKDYL